MTTRTTSPTIELIHQHGSTRRYKADPVPVPIIEAIVAAGQHASTSSNLQTYSIIVVTDSARREELSTLCGGQRHIAQAPVFLAFCADLARLDYICKQIGYTQVTNCVENFLIAAIDAAIVAQNAALAAESLDLGICYIGSIRNNPREVIELLGLPKLVFPLVGMTIGYPAGKASTRPRLPLREVLHWDKYHAPNDEALEEYDRAMIATGIYTNRQVHGSGDETKTDTYGWREHSARRVSKPVRVFLRDVLKEQGFTLK